MVTCEVPHSERYVVPREAAYDLGRYIRVMGIYGKVRFLCEDCATGRISPYRKDKTRIKR